MPEPRYRARREPQPRRFDPRSGTRARVRPASEGRSPTSRRQDPRRRRRRSRAPIGLLALALVVALGAITATALTLRAPATAPESSAAAGDASAGSASASAAADRSTDAHAKRQACDDCHEPPAPSHYRAECSTCHAPSRPFSEPKLTHPVFGAHTVATHSCDACHRPDPPPAGKANEAEKTGSSPSCRACHRNKCGKGVTTMAGCLKCHQKGTTDSWVRSATP